MIRYISTLILIVLGAFTGTAVAASAAADPTASELAKSIFDAVMHGQWWAALAAGVIMACALARKYMPDSWKTGTRGDIIGVSTVFLMSFAGAIATWAIAPGAVMSLAVISTAFKVAAAAIGGWTILHKVAGWLVAWGKLPAWATSILSLITMLIGSDAVTKAESAGDAAVVATPAPGMAAGGTPTEVE